MTLKVKAWVPQPAGGPPPPDLRRGRVSPREASARILRTPHLLQPQLQAQLRSETHRRLRMLSHGETLAPAKDRLLTNPLTRDLIWSSFLVTTEPEVLRPLTSSRVLQSPARSGPGGRGHAVWGWEQRRKSPPFSSLVEKSTCSCKCMAVWKRAPEVAGSSSCAPIGGWVIQLRKDRLRRGRAYGCLEMPKRLFSGLWRGRTPSCPGPVAPSFTTWFPLTLLTQSLSLSSRLQHIQNPSLSPSNAYLQGCSCPSLRYLLPRLPNRLRCSFTLSSCLLGPALFEFVFLSLLMR